MSTATRLPDSSAAGSASSAAGSSAAGSMGSSVFSPHPTSTKAMIKTNDKDFRRLLFIFSSF
jgi:hypothetical protein